MVFNWKWCHNGGDDYQQIGGLQGQRFGVRHFQCFLAFCGLAVAYALRVNLAVAIVAMTDGNATNSEFGNYEWSEGIKSYLLSSFFWGYVLTQFPGGYLAHTYGAKLPFLFGVLICSCLTMLTPYCAEVGDWQLLLPLRIVQGLAQGVIFPSTHTLLSKWSPVAERAQLVTYAYAGTQFGTVVMLSVSGYIASSWMGWPGIFYCSGLVGIVWSIVWYFCSASTPAEHPSISTNELRYIQTSGHSRLTSATGHKVVKSRPPWKKIFTSVPFMTLMVTYCANNWAFWTLLSEIPAYMKNILKEDIEVDGLMSSLPYVAMLFLCFGFNMLSDCLNRKYNLSLNFSRKLFNSVGMWLPMVMLIALGYLETGDSPMLALALLTIAVGSNAATYLGAQVNFIDLSPNYAGTLIAISNCAANIVSIIALLMVGVIVKDETNRLQWRIVFSISAVCYFLGNVLYIIFGSASVQAWNFPDETSDFLEDDELDTEAIPLQEDLSRSGLP